MRFPRLTMSSSTFGLSSVARTGSRGQALGEVGMRSRTNRGARLPFDEPIEVEPRTGSGRNLRVVGLFAGIGGFELGFERAGHETAALCEIDVGANAVLDKRFPHAPVRHLDVSTFDLPRDVDAVVAGFPCQDLSQAGRVAGIAGDQSGLVEHVFRMLGRRKADWVVLENVPFMLRLGGGRALDVVLGQLERLGYAWAYRVIDTRAFGLPQRRERVFIVASRCEDPRTVLFAGEAVHRGSRVEPDRDGIAFGFYWTEGTRGLGWAEDAVPTLKGGSAVGIPSPPAVWLPTGEIARPDITDAERLQGFRPNWTSPAGPRVGDRWKLVGNAVSVPVAKWLGERLREPRAVKIRDYWPHPGGAWPRAGWNVGHGRWGAELSSWPLRRKAKPLADFLRNAGPLSEKATSGFLRRARASRLRFRPGFLDAVELHLERVAAGSE